MNIEWRRKEKKKKWFICTFLFSKPKSKIMNDITKVGSHFTHFTIFFLTFKRWGSWLYLIRNNILLLSFVLRSQKMTNEWSKVLKLIDQSILPLYLRPLVKFKFINRKIRQINALNGTDVWWILHKLDLLLMFSM